MSEGCKCTKLNWNFSLSRSCNSAILYILQLQKVCEDRLAIWLAGTPGGTVRLYSFLPSLVISPLLKRLIAKGSQRVLRLLLATPIIQSGSTFCILATNFSQSVFRGPKMKTSLNSSARRLISGNVRNV